MTTVQHAEAEELASLSVVRVEGEVHIIDESQPADEEVIATADDELDALADAGVVLLNRRAVDGGSA